MNKNAIEKLGIAKGVWWCMVTPPGSSKYGHNRGGLGGCCMEKTEGAREMA